jgi:hypothetical protein
MSKSKYFMPAIMGLFFVLAPTFALAQTPPPIVITTTSLPAGTLGTAVSDTLAASGGVAPYTWSATHLPSGLSVDPSTGVISGVPTLPASASWSLPLPTSYAVTFQVQDAVGQISTTTINWGLTPTFAYTLSPAVNGVTPEPTTMHVHGTMGVDICPGYSGGYVYKVFQPHRIYNLNGQSGNGPAIDDTFTFETGPYSQIQIVCTGNNTYDTLDGFTVSSLPTISTNSLLQPGIVGQSYSTTLQYSLSSDRRHLRYTNCCSLFNFHCASDRRIGTDEQCGVYDVYLQSPTRYYNHLTPRSLQRSDVLSND